MNSPLKQVLLALLDHPQIIIEMKKQNKTKLIVKIKELRANCLLCKFNKILN
jgi:hypothetical protein